MDYIFIEWYEHYLIALVALYVPFYRSQWMSVSMEITLLYRTLSWLCYLLFKVWKIKKVIRINPCSFLQKHERRLSTAARYFQSYRYKEGFRHIISKSKSARKALTERVAKVTKKEMKQLLDEKSLSIMSKVSAETFRQVNFSALISSVRRKVPFLYEVLVASISKDRKHKR